MFNFKVFGFVLMISAINIVSSHKCNFIEKSQSSNKHYTCVFALNSTEREHHLADKNDNDVLRVDVDLDSTNYSPILTESEFQFCKKYPKMQKIHLKKIKSIGKHFLKQCRNLESFTMLRTETKSIPAILFAKNPKLTTLDLSKNRITTINENAFVNNKELIYLSFDDNRISTIQPNTFKSLTKITFLGLRRNKIKILNPSWFETLASLKYLDLGMNVIADLPKNIFGQLSNLQKLYLDNNKLKIVHFDSFEAAPKLSEIHLDYNKIKSIDERIVNNTPIQRFAFNGAICTKRKSIKRDTMQADLKICFDNYQLRM